MPTFESSTPPPADFDSLRHSILEKREHLPKRLKQVAIYALDHPDEMAFQTVAAVSEAAGVQPSTLVRFAQYFGFDGFSSLQQVFQARLRGRVASYDDRLRHLVAREGERAGPAGLLGGAIAAAHRSLDTLGQRIDAERFERASALLAEADTIYLLAKRRSYPVGSYMAYMFGKLQVKCVLVGSPAGIDDEILGLAGPRDAAFAISFAPYAAETALQAKAMAERGVPVVSLTDSAFSPLVAVSSLWFEVTEADHAGFRSLSASMALAMALPLSIAELRLTRSREDTSTAE